MYGQDTFGYRLPIDDPLVKTLLAEGLTTIRKDEKGEAMAFGLDHTEICLYYYYTMLFCFVKYVERARVQEPCLTPPLKI